MLFVACLWLFPSTAQAQNPVTWSLQINAPGSLKPGDKLTAKVTAQIQGGWHLYSLTQGAGGPVPTRITLPEGQPFKLTGSAQGPRPRVSMDPNFEINTETYESAVTFSVPITVAGDVTAGPQTLNVNVRFQTCNDKNCLPPRTVKLNASLTIVALGVVAPASTQFEATPDAKSSPTVGPASASANNNKSQPSPTPATSVSETAASGKQDAATQTSPATGANGPQTTAANPVIMNAGGRAPTGSLWSFIWLAMTVGALSLLTPCVFPMVPITVSYFTNHAAGNRRGAVRDASIYAVGIILTFTALGVALAVLFGAAGINKFAANPWINLLITGIFLAFALSLFGAFNLQVPSSILTKLDALSRREEGGGGGHIIALLLMGLTFSLTSFTCTAPFVGTLLVMAAQGKWIFPVVGMLAFSTVFALPFFILALAPQLVSQLPKSGGWLNSVKVVMGFLEIAAAMKFLSNADLVWRWSIFTREVVLASWVAVALLIALYLLGKFQLSHDTPTQHIGAVRLMIALVSLAFSFYLLTGLFGRRLGELESFLPPATENSAGTVLAGGSNRVALATNGELTWITNDYESALKQAKAENKPVFIDFTGYTCTNCRWMEANMFTKGPVKEELAKYVRARLYTDGEGQPYEGFQQMQQDKFGTVALPLYAIVSGDGSILTTFPGLTRDQSEFVSFLKTGQARFVPNVVSMNREVISH